MKKKFSGSKSFEIFCQVVDNFGDIGFCWRLANGLANRGKKVVLWVDDWQAVSRFFPSAVESGSNLDVRRWRHSFPDVAPKEVVIEAFGCEIPENHLRSIVACPRKPLWINLEYLSAENWVEGFHLRMSPHPVLPLEKYFFFPGFTDKTGGLIGEPGLPEERRAFQRDAGGRSRFLSQLGILAEEQNRYWVSLFSYEQPLLSDWIRCLVGASSKIGLLVPEGKVLPDLARAFGKETLAAGDMLSLGALLLKVLPFSSQDDYDRLLWCCDFNIVRGEDSFVRAQWAAKPFIWHIYPQAEEAHGNKLDAFLSHYGAALAERERNTLANLWHVWNAMENRDLAAAWDDFAGKRVLFERHAEHWADTLQEQTDLIDRLLSWCDTKRA